MPDSRFQIPNARSQFPSHEVVIGLSHLGWDIGDGVWKLAHVSNSGNLPPPDVIRSVQKNFPLQMQRSAAASRKKHVQWREYFRDSSLWLLNGNSQYSAASPDIIHKNTSESLWIDGRFNPCWVGEELRRRGLAMITAHKEKFSSSLEMEQHKQELGFVEMLKDCVKKRDIDRGYNLHVELVKQGLLERNPYIASSLVSMYAKWGMLSKAKKVLEELPVRNVVIWNALISGVSQEGECEEAFIGFETMLKEGHLPNNITFICILMACRSTRALRKGQEIHSEIARRGLLENNITLNTALIDMYAKCGAINKAREVLDRLPFRDVVSWNALLAGYAESQGHESMDCFERMQIEGIFPNEVTFVCLLKACGNKIAIDEGRKIHDVIVQRGLLEGNFVLGNALVDMYAKCGMVEEAQRILEELPFRDIVSWSSLIAGYSQEGRGHKALACFEQMKREGLFPNEITFLCTLKACGNTGAIGKGKQIHDQVINRGMLGKNIALGNALVDMYAKCGVLLKAQEVLEELPMRDVVSWSSLIAGYAKHGQCHEALSCFEQMQKEGLSPDEIAFLSALNACTHSGKMNEAQTYYESMSKNYGMAPSVEHHTCIMVAFACSGNLEKAMSIVRTLPCSDHPQMWIALLNACTRWGNVSLGRIAFDQVMQLGTNLSAPYIIMANMYAAAGMLEMAGEIEAMRIKHAN